MLRKAGEDGKGEPMTEEEWLSAGDPQAMCAFVREATAHWRTRWSGWVKAKRFHVSDRKLRLIELACCERVAGEVWYPELEVLLPLARRHASAGLPAEELADAELEALKWGLAVLEGRRDLSSSMRQAAASLALSLWRLFAGPRVEVNLFDETARAQASLTMSIKCAGDEQVEGLFRAEKARQADLVRDVLGNPFQPESLDPAWLSGDVLRLAQAIDAGKDDEGMPVLADALEEAGCTSEAVLAHCRSGGEHVRGCWVVDLLLARE